MHHAAASPSSVRNGLSQQSQLANPSLPIISTPLVMSAQLLAGLHWDLNWGIKLKSNTRIKRTGKGINPARSVVCHRNMKVHVPGRWWSKQSEERECKHSWEMDSSTSQPKLSGKEQLTPDFPCSLTHFASSLLWVRSTDRAPYSSLFNLSAQSPLVGQWPVTVQPTPQLCSWAPARRLS